jgi:hypothetical protein
MTEVPDIDTVMMYSDADVLFLGSYDRVIERFLGSDTPVALFRDSPEDCNVVAGAHCVPSEPLEGLFPNLQEWYNKPAFSTSIVIAGGPTYLKARDLGQKCLNLWPQVRPFAMLGEQSVFNYVMYEDKVPYCPLTTAEHCILWQYNFQSESSLRYGPTDRVTLKTGEPVLARHFVGPYKKYLYDHLNRLEQEYGVV